MARPLNMVFYHRLERELRSGRFDKMRFLPSERQLAEEFGVGRCCLRNTLLALERNHLVRLVPQRGWCPVPEQDTKRLHQFMVVEPQHLSQAWERRAILSGICEKASELFAEVILSFLPQSTDAAELIERIQGGNLQGVIFLEKILDYQGFKKLQKSNVPCIVANLEEDLESVHCQSDYRAAGRIAGKYLVEAGHRKIGILTGDPQLMFYREMRAGFQEVLDKVSCRIPPEWIVPLTPGQEESPVLEKLLRKKERPTAFFAMRDSRAAVLFREARAVGLSIPEDISVIGYDNISWPGAQEKHLTTIQQPVEEIGRVAVEMLGEWYVSGKKPENRVIRGELIERASVRKTGNGFSRISL